jgi:hypothetical protein
MLKIKLMMLGNPVHFDMFNNIFDRIEYMENKLTYSQYEILRDDIVGKYLDLIECGTYDENEHTITTRVQNLMEELSA